MRQGGGVYIERCIILMNCPGRTGRVLSLPPSPTGLRTNVDLGVRQGIIFLESVRKGAGHMLRGIVAFTLLGLGMLLWVSAGYPSGEIASARPEARLPQAPAPGIWHFLDLDLEAPEYPYLKGTHRVWGWRQVHPAPGIFIWRWVERWVSEAAAAGLPVALGINTYDGYFDGGDQTPTWVYERYPDARIVCPDGWTIPKYWHPGWQAALEEMVADFAARFDGDPRVAWVEIGVGVYGETAPVSANFRNGQYVQCLQAVGLTPEQWVKTVQNIVDIYVRHFRYTPLFLQMAPAFQKWWERREFVNYAAAKGVGLKHNGLQVDMGTAVFGPCPESGSQCESGFVELMRRWGEQVPIAWEGDPRVLPPTNPLDPQRPEWAVYWQILNALDKHSDYILYNRWLAQHPALRDLFTWANAYLGRTVYDTPSVWVALRETRLDPVRNPQRGNFTFWLYQNDAVPQGRTVPVWDVGPPPQGYYARRTDEATGNRYMYFDVDDRYIFDGNVRGAAVRIVYLDQGTDTWALEYDGPQSVTLAGTVQKTDSGLWKEVTFELSDVRFANRLPGGGDRSGSDFRIDSRGDGDEIVHFVEVIRTPVVTPTPTPTRTPVPFVKPTPTPGPPLYRVVLQQGRDGYTGAEDTTLNREQPHVNYGAAPTLSLRAQPPSRERRVLMRFDLAERIPARAQVAYAWLMMYTLSPTGPDIYPRAYRVLRPWTAAEATWQQATAGVSWATPGADAPGVDRASTWYSQGWAHKQGEWTVIEVTTLVQEWLQAPERNFGLVLIPFSYGGYTFEFASAEYPERYYRPRLIVAYTLPEDPPITPTPTPLPSPTPTPTPTLTPTPAPVLWVVHGRLYDRERGVDTPIAGGVVTVTLGSAGPVHVATTDVRGVFAVEAYAPDVGPLRYQAAANGYVPVAGELPPRRPRIYTLAIPLTPRASQRHFVPWISR